MKGLTASSCGMLGYLCMFGKELKPHIASATFSWLYLTSAYLHNFSSACRYSFQLGPYQTTATASTYRVQRVLYFRKVRKNCGDDIFARMQRNKK